MEEEAVEEDDDDDEEDDEFIRVSGNNARLGRQFEESFLRRGAPAAAAAAEEGEDEEEEEATEQGAGTGGRGQLSCFCTRAFTGDNATSPCQSHTHDNRPHQSMGTYI